MKNILQQITVIALVIIGLATISVIVSQRAQTEQIVQSAGDKFAAALQAAMGPLGGY